MNFDRSEDHVMLADTLRRFLEGAAGVEARATTAYEAPYHDPALWQGLAELGILGAFLPEDQGGFGGSAEDVAVIFEEIGHALCAEPLLANLLGLRLLAEAGEAALIEAVIGGETRVALAVSEPQVAMDLRQIQTTARPDGEGWRLSGRKTSVYGAPGAQVVLVAAQGPEGLGLFAIDAPEMIDAPMVDGGGIADIVLDEAPARRLLARAEAPLEEALDLARIALCAEAVGASARLIDMTVDYLKQRKQFGRAIGTFQALQHRVVDMLVELEQCRSITISATAHFGTPQQARHVSMAKNLIGRKAAWIAEEAVQLHGGIGMTWEYPGAHFAKRLVMIDAQLGDRHDHLGRMIAQDAAADSAAPATGRAA